jgi:hypothetical protein
VLLLLGLLFGIHILWILGIIAIVVGLILLAVGYANHPVGGRRYWY